MKRNAGVREAATCCGVLLMGISCAVAAEVTHGDLMLSSVQGFRVQVSDKQTSKRGQAGHRALSAEPGSADAKLPSADE